MTTFITELQPCPICNTAVEVNQLMSTNNLGGPDSDLRPHAVGADPLHIRIATCPHCGFSGYSESFSATTFSAETRERIRQMLAERGRDRLGGGYGTAAEIAELLGVSPYSISQWYLQAAWYSADVGDTDAEMVYRRNAITALELALERNALGRNPRPVVLYLLGELYRRVGDIAEAHAYFEQVLADPDESLVELKARAQRQRDAPQSRW